jgi:hypothetical protein
LKKYIKKKAQLFSRSVTRDLACGFIEQAIQQANVRSQAKTCGTFFGKAAKYLQKSTTNPPETVSAIFFIFRKKLQKTLYRKLLTNGTDFCRFKKFCRG